MMRLMTTMIVTEMTITGSTLVPVEGSLRDTVTGDENSPPPTDVTDWT